jgi:serine/threonine-protein kinase HipA
LDLDKKLAAFGIARFDRHADQRVPIHTLAGVLHQDFRLPGQSYATLLRATRLMTRDVREVQKAYTRCVFNVIFHNRDDHSKNFSFRLAQDRRWYLAPCYDLTFSDGPGGEHFLDIAGEGRAPSQAHLLQLARDEGIAAAFATHTIALMQEQAANIKQLAQAFPIRSATVRRVINSVGLA